MISIIHNIVVVVVLPFFFSFVFVRFSDVFHHHRQVFISFSSCTITHMFLLFESFFFFRNVKSIINRSLCRNCKRYQTKWTETRHKYLLVTIDIMKARIDLLERRTNNDDHPS
jgi:hypothetical protein